MRIGDLVRRTPKWGDWVKHNPWMYTDNDLEVGIIVAAAGSMDYQVLWPSGSLEWYAKNYVKKINVEH